MKKKIIIVAGATGGMGKAFCGEIDKDKKYSSEYEVVGITSDPQKVNEKMYLCNLLSTTEVTNLLKKVNIIVYDEIILLHCVGKFKFDESGSKVIDEEIYNSNYVTFFNLASALGMCIKKDAKLTLCAFGSISDRYEIPLWYSYSKAKNDLRKYMQSTISNNIRSLFVSVSSTEKEEERPFADKTYWLSCKEVAEKCLNHILDSDFLWQEIFIIKPNPNYKKDYFTNLEDLKKIWIEQLYGKVL